MRIVGEDGASGEHVRDAIRSNRPEQADGATPFTRIPELTDIGGLSATVGVRDEFRPAREYAASQSGLRRIRRSHPSATTISPMTAESG